MRRKFIFIGSKPLGLSVLKKVHEISSDNLVGVITLDDRDDARGCLEEYVAFCREGGIDLIVANNRDSLERHASRFNAEICLVLGWYRIFPKAFIEMFEHIIGVHNSLLPKYRGMSPLVWSIINGEKKIGYSVFSIVEEMDAGDIWWQEDLELGDNENISDALKKIECALLNSIEKKWLPILNDQVQPVKQNHSLATYCAERLPDDGRINWHLSALMVHNFIRALQFPYPGAFVFFNGYKVYIVKSRVFSQRYYGVPGQIARFDEDGSAYVVCGDNRAIIIDYVRLNDNKLFRPKEIFRSVRIRFQ
ncbi:MAG: methionyl-tRNA formyltransferase [Methanobacteriota archaeon]|nr:MAG: methionyl-tRNA formyltransferase [Euryarchaeota archaeon]